MNQNGIIIRKFHPTDREEVRKISCETAFLEEDRTKIITDDEILADILTKYFTDYEADSCYVAVKENKVIGYLIGSKDVARMQRIMISKIVPRLLLKAIKNNSFFQASNLRCLFYCLISLWKGEFNMPNFSEKFPATLHINISKDYRNFNLGTKLIEKFVGYLRENKVTGVHLATLSNGAKIFFTKLDFKILFQGKRTYLKYCLGKEVAIYVLGKEIEGGH